MEDLLKGISEFVSLPAGQLMVAVFIIMLGLIAYAIHSGNKNFSRAADLTTQSNKNTEKSMQLLREAQQSHQDAEQFQRVNETRQSEALDRHTKELEALGQTNVLIQGTLENVTSLLAKFTVNQDDLKRGQAGILDGVSETLTIVRPLPGTTADTYLQLQDLTSEFKAWRSGMEVSLQTLTGAVETMNRRHTTSDEQVKALIEAINGMRDDLQEFTRSADKNITELLARTASPETP